MTTDARTRYLDVLLKRLEAHEGPVADAERYMERLDVLAGVDIAQKLLTAGSPFAPSVEAQENEPPEIEHGSGLQVGDGASVAQVPTVSAGPEHREPLLTPDPLPGAHGAPQQVEEPVVQAHAAAPPATPAAAPPEPLDRSTPSGNPISQLRAGRRGNFCSDDCGTQVSGPGKRCPKCSGLARRKPLRPPVDISVDTTPAPSDVAQIQEPWSKDVPRTAPPAAQTVKFCARCNGRMTYERTATGDEWTCFACGNVSYGERFEPLVDDPALDGRSRREPSHGGSRL